MQTTALRIYGRNDLRLESFELPEVGEDAILAEVFTDSVCMSSHKAALLGADHKRIPDNVAENPTIIGHEFAGVLRQVGDRWAGQFKPGMKFSIQPALGYKGTLDAPGYSFPTVGGMATFVRIPSCVMESGCLLPFEGEGFFKASLSEPMSCIVGAAHAQYHTRYGTYRHEMGIIEGGRCALLAGAGPMGLGFVDYLVNGPRRPGLLVVTDIDNDRLTRASQLFPPEAAAKHGVTLIYRNTAESADPVTSLRQFTDDQGYDDVFVLAPVAAVIEQGDAILGRNGCLNFFAGPTDASFSAKFNFYNVHYAETHIVGTSGGNTDDMKESLELMGQDRINPAAMITHIGGMTCGAETIKKLPEIPGAKKLLYTHLDLPLVAIADFAERGKQDAMFAELARLCEAYDGLWNLEAEQYLMENGPPLQTS